MRQTEHRIPICLAPEIRVGLFQKMAKEAVSEMYSIQQYIVRGLYQDHHICKEVYDYYMMEYSRKLKSEREIKQNSAMSRQELESKQKQDELTRKFRMVADDWNYDHKPQKLEGKTVSWREYWLAQAQKHPDNPGAQLIMQKYVRP